jgi:ATPase
MKKIVKTIEAPRDLVVSDAVVQYSFHYGTHDEVRDILLLSRPDFTVYDEIRNTSDFVLYKDLRLTGI